MRKLKPGKGNKTALADAALRLPQKPARAKQQSKRSAEPNLSNWFDGDEALTEIAAPIDYFGAFRSMVLVARWTTTIASLGLTATQLTSSNYNRSGVFCGLLLLYTIFRTLKPIRDFGTSVTVVKVVAEVLALCAAVVLTGYWESPFVFSLMVGVVLAGFTRGVLFSLSVASSVAIIINLAMVYSDRYLNTAIWAESKLLSIQWTGLLFLAGLITSYTRRISSDSMNQSVGLDRLNQLANANALLFSLHSVAQKLPASLDYEEVLDTTIERLRSLVEFDAVAILVLDDTDDSWLVARREGLRLADRLAHEDLPVQLRRVLAGDDVVIYPRFRDGASGLAPSLGSGIYASLHARGSIIGLVCLEHRDENHFTAEHNSLVVGFVEPIALAIDNARWFLRLRTVGADEERTRIARDLHDRIGQSLAYLAFELDRIMAANKAGKDVETALDQLRSDVRGVIGEVRDTLYDLRTDVSEVADLPLTLSNFLDRLEARTNFTVIFNPEYHRRLGLLQEREVWRIAQEALVNVERHASATMVRVNLYSDENAVVLEVIDNGIGFPVGKAGRLDSYGIMGMRERAASIGASLEVRSEVGKGTRIRCVVEPTT